jgi:hypothetical protein
MVDIIAIIADLAGIDAVVAATLKPASLIAAIASIAVAIIATLATINPTITAAFGAANTVAAVAGI